MRRMMCVGLGLAVVGASGCNEAIELGAVNRCDGPVDVTINLGSAAEPRYGWEPLGVLTDTRASIALVSDDSTTEEVLVRVDEASEPVTFTVAIADLEPPPDDADGGDYDREIVLEGDRCPS